jgi:carboxyl-terminal processing protease
MEMVMKPFRFFLVSFSLCIAWFAFAGEEAAPEKFEDASRAFQAAKETLLHNYLRSDVTEADLYRAAVQGMLNNVDPKLSAYNKLLGPAETAELKIEMTGRVVGIGIQVKFDAASGIVDVLGVIPGSPAQTADVREGDKIFRIDGVAYKGKTLTNVVAAIRGKEGDSVSLEMLRDASVITKSVRRERVLFDSVSHQRLPGDIELLSIQSFSERTPASLKSALAEIAKSAPKGLVIDLRNNAGGLLDQSIESAKLLLPKGTVITKLLKRGQKVETIVADQEPILKAVPTVVLTSDSTMSSAELLASALRLGLHAPILGGKTHGKWSVQSLEELPNHFVMKYTVAMFQTPDGQSYEGTGLAPDIEVTMDAETLDRVQHVKSVDARLAADVQLRAASNLLRMRP